MDHTAHSPQYVNRNETLCDILDTFEKTCKLVEFRDELVDSVPGRIKNYLSTEIERTIRELYGRIWQHFENGPLTFERSSLRRRPLGTTLLVLPDFKINPTRFNYITISDKPIIREYKPDNIAQISTDFKHRSGPFLSPISIIPIKTDRKHELWLLLNTLDLSFTFESNTLLLITDDSCYNRITLVYTIIGDYCDRELNHAIEYRVPETGKASPRTLFLDIPFRTNKHCETLKNGLGFVHILRPRTPEEVNSLIARISEITEAKNLPGIENSLRQTCTGKPTFAKGFSKDVHREINKIKKASVIKPADKGGRIVVMSRNFYKTAVLKLLLNNKDYMVVEGSGIIDKLVATVNRTHSIIHGTCRSLKDKIKPNIDVEPRLGLFYGLPKVHKSESSPPMRPVVSQINHPTFKLAKLLDDQCKHKLYAGNPHLLKSTLHTLEELRDLDGSNHKLITYDVSSLYTSIPLPDGIRKFKFESNKWFANNPEMRIAVSHILPAVLYNNYFSFDNTVYKQTCGVAMGSPLGPLFANTYMLHVDKEIMRMDGVVKYLRYIDDVFLMIRKEIDITEFTNKINSINKNINFELGDHGNKIVFLDTTLYLSEQGKIEYCIYEKPISATSRYIHASSLHPKHCLEGVVTGSIKRSFRLCSSKFSAVHFIQTLMRRFREQGVSFRTFAAKLNSVVKNKVRIVNKTKKKRIICRAHKYMKQDKIATKGLLDKDVQWVYRDFFSFRKLLVRARFNSMCDSHKETIKPPNVLDYHQ